MMHDCFVFPTKFEAGALVRGKGRGSKERVWVCGLGQKRAVEEVRKVVEAVPGGRIWLCGFAGGLKESIKEGEGFVVGADVETEVRLRALNVPFAKTLTVDELVADPVEKRKLGRATGADLVEMENSAVEAFLRKTGNRYLCVRVVCDGMARALPAQILKLAMDEDGGIFSGARLALAWWRCPKEWGQFLSLSLRSWHSQRRMREFVERVRRVV